MREAEACSAQLPLLFCQLLLSGLHLTTPMAPDPSPAREGIRRRHVFPKEGRLALAAGGPDLPTRGGPGPPRDSWTPLAHALALHPGGPGPPRAPLPLAHIYMQDPGLQGPWNAATPHLEDGTPYNDDNAACWGCQDDVAISARPRTMPRTTATPDAMPYSVLPTVLDHSTPAIRGKENDFHDPRRMYTVPPCVYKRRRRASFKGSSSTSRDQAHSIERNTQYI